MINVRFAKLIRKVNEGEEYKPSLFAWAKVPYERTYKNVTAYGYLFYLNLWLVEIEVKFTRRI